MSRSRSLRVGRPRGPLLAVAAVLLGLPVPAAGQGVVDAGVVAVESRLDEAGDALRRGLDAVPGLGALARRVRLSGSWSGAWLDRGSDSQVVDERWVSWDARVFADLELARDVAVGEHTLLQAAGVGFEWELFRNGVRSDDLGELYLDLQGLGGSSWLNLRLGRFQLPVGEGYLRYGRGAADNPFLTNPVGSPWWWDEGVRLHGRDARGRFGYVASLTEGTTPRNWSLDGFDQGTLKLFVEPASWLHLSVSALVSGELGGPGEPAQGALWLGESWARAFGSGAPPPYLQDGSPVPPGPDALRRTLYLGADAILRHPRGARLWLSWGRFDIDSQGGGFYDRRLHAWLAELVLEGRLASPGLRPFYLALRASGLESLDRGEGALLDVRYTGRFGYSMRALRTWSVALGWRLGRHLTLKLEYTAQDVALVQGASAALRAPGDSDLLAASVGVHF